MSTSEASRADAATDQRADPADSSQPVGDSYRRPRVAIVFGGRSAEHGVSCATAAGVLRAIDRERYDVVPVGIARDGRWVLVDDDPEPLELAPGHLPEVDGRGAGVLVPLSTTERMLSVLEPGRPPRLLGEVDVVLPLLHGPFGEDGTLQGMLDLADIRYVGSGVLASAVMMDKHYMKVVFAGAGLPIGPYAVITDREWQRDPAAAMDAASSLGFPVFVKPARAGSSLGISKVSDPEALQAAIELAREHDPKVVVEAAIVGREIECGVLEGRDGAPPRTSEVGEIVVVKGHEFYDFEAKYLDGTSVNIVPADIPETLSERIRTYAVQAFEAIGCEGLARVDFFDTLDGLIINEINTMPGFTPFSMFPLLWEASGVPYAELVDRLIQLALNRDTGLR
jgi:D-alanine-D-alanine ligase